MQENPTITIRQRKPINFVDRTGQVYGRLTVLCYAGSNHRYRALWRCLCECGSITITAGDGLNNGSTKSCGCLQRTHGKNNRTHGFSGTRIYELWCQMINRCTKPSNRAYDNYGGRGITVCERWQTFEEFFADMGERPHSRSLDRINNDGGYWCGKCDECIVNNRPPNCRWATRTEQANNKRDNRLLTYQNLTLPLAEWARRVKIGREIIRVRLRRGWSVEEALSIPLVPNDSSRRRKRTHIAP